MRSRECYVHVYLLSCEAIREILTKVTLEKAHKQFVTTTHIHDDVIKWKHFPASLAFCAGNSPVTGEFPSQRPVTRSFDVFFDLHINRRLSKQLRRW